jgi:hypothetical protein
MHLKAVFITGAIMEASAGAGSFAKAGHLFMQMYLCLQHYERLSGNKYGEVYSISQKT